MLNKRCTICKKEFVVVNNRKKAKFCSMRCKGEWQREMPEKQRKMISETLKRKGILPPSRMIENPKYNSLHHWIRKNFGKATKCENPNCPGKSKRFEWAKIKGKKYDRSRESYKQFCISCHKKYDMTEATRIQIIKNLKH